MKTISQDIIQNLQYVKVSKTNLDLSRFPNFMIVGPQRTGTTWLYWSLRQHPQISFARPKELFYFNFLDMPDFPMYRSSELSWYLQFFRENPVRYLWKNFTTLRYHGEFYRPKIRGEATATYAAMKIELIKDVLTLNPDIKIILMIRNPIDRAWSHAKKDLLKEAGKKFDEVSDQEFEQFFNDPYQLACGQYTAMIDKWSSCLPQGNLFVGFYDDIQQASEQLLSRIFDFLGVRNKAKYYRLAQTIVNPTESRDIPEKYQKMLAAIFQDEITKLKQEFDLSW
ncbi:MAG: sulfotransferase [Symploca sp. SIO2G7]|nr:sulfotransferase [Symploca sp. SIO2G7]